MIRPWYRSRLFWLGIPGLLFLLWGWWDSGMHYSQFTAAAPIQIQLDASRGWLMVSWQPRRVSSQWTFMSDRWPMDLDEEASKESAPRSRQFDLAPAFSLRKEAEEVAINDPLLPPGSTYVPYVEWRIQVAFWLLVLGYLLSAILLIGGWQRRKASVLKSSASPPP